MARRRRRLTGRWVSIVTVVGIGVVVVWFFTRPGSNPQATSTPLAGAPRSDTPDPTPGEPLAAGPSEAGPADGGGATSTGGDMAGAGLVAEGQRARQRGDLITARTTLNRALAKGLDDQQAVAVRQTLQELADETIFSARRIPGDPVVERHLVAKGETLGKIAARYHVTDNLLATINGLRNKNVIRQGQAFKVLTGPFHAVVHKELFRLDVYLGDLYVRSYPVGLGADDGTPTGVWAVKDKLVNPTYYPPRGGQIIAADDPKNPLGERWIGLHGISGDAKGQLRYGIHGTIEPDSIGKNVSMGCIRLRNPDVQALFDLVVVKHSKITVR